MDNLHTDAQFRALHLWFRKAAEALNSAGLSQQVVLERLIQRGLDCPWSDSSFKANVWKPVYKAMTDKDSTKEASRTDYNAEYTALCKWFGQEFGVTLPPFPDRFSQASEALNAQNTTN